jgi:hypothetical protein
MHCGRRCTSASYSTCTSAGEGPVSCCLLPCFLPIILWCSVALLLALEQSTASRASCGELVQSCQLVLQICLPDATILMLAAGCAWLSAKQVLPSCLTCKHCVAAAGAASWATAHRWYCHVF